MTRKFLDDVRNNVNTQIPDNTTGLIDAADVRENVIDVIDSTVQDEAGFAGESSLSSITIGTTWTSLDDSLFPGIETFWDETVGGDATFLKMDQVNGTITTNTTAGFSYRFLSSITLDAGNNDVIECTIGENGSPGFDVQSIVGTGGTRNQSMNPQRYILSAPSDAVYTLMVRTTSGTNSITIAQRTMGGIIIPTNNP